MTIITYMISSLEQLLNSSLNYAGLYYPSQVSLREALREYVDFSNSQYSFMRGDFVMPHHELPMLGTFADRKHRLLGMLPLCITGPESNTLFEFKNALLKIEHEIKTVHSAYPGEVRTNILELTLPSVSVENLNPEELVKALESVVRTASESRLLPHRVFLEIPGSEFDAETTKKITKVIAVHNKSILKRKIKNYLFSGLKIKCNAAEGGKAPTAEYLAKVILYARDANVAVKFSGFENTPLPTYDYSAQSKIHGLLNILIASVLAYTQDLNHDEMIDVLEDNNPENFTLKDDYLAWRELAAPIPEIKMLRMLSITSFNVTGFRGPVDGMNDLNLLL